jgi:hypothetical protein
MMTTLPSTRYWTHIYRLGLTRRPLQIRFFSSSTFLPDLKQRLPDNVGCLQIRELS